MNKVNTYNFNFGWHFMDGEAKNQNYGGLNGGDFNHPQWLKAGNQAVAVAGYPDEDWIDVKVPHDYAIEKCNFTPEKPASIGSLGGEIAWYRKEFVLPESIDGKRVFIRCDGVYRDSQVWCNGHFIGRHLGGYMGFTYELTEVIKAGEINAIAIRVDATESEGWWYTGAGMIRDVWLLIQPEVCVTDHGAYFKTERIDLETSACRVSCEIEISNGSLAESMANVKVEIYDGTELICDAEESVLLDALSRKEVKLPVEILNLKPWDLESTHLYTGKVYINGVLCYEDTFGPRKIEYNAKDGMFLNGKKIFMRGACGHDDFAGVGAALPAAIVRYKVQKLMEMGCNAYRCSHNPPPPVFLEICDELGMLVVDETRLPGTSYEMESDFIELIKRDRNHPSVVFWSMGNEEMRIQGNETGIRIFNRMRAIGQKYDDARDYLFAINCDYNNLINYQCDHGLNLAVNGVNYQLLRNHDALKIIHEDHPQMCFINTETTGICSIRGYRLFDGPKYHTKPEKKIQVWTNPKFDHNFSCYGDFHPTWGLLPEEVMKDYQGMNHMLGMFLWTGFDYRGETFPFLYPQTVSSYGVIDLCGFFKDWAYYLKAVWVDEPMIHLLPAWNLPEEENEPIDVWAFSNCNDAELFLNHRSLGRQKKGPLDKFTWTVPYEKGSLHVVAYDGDRVVCEDSVVTSGQPDSLILTTEKHILQADGSDVSVVNVSVQDKDGNMVTDSSLKVEFAVSGVGTIKGVGNGKPDSIEPDKSSVRELYAGRAVVLVESTFEPGIITVTAKAGNVKPSAITLSVNRGDEQRYVNASWTKIQADGKTDDWV